MSSFIRRFLFDPGNAVLLNIESVNILDLTPPSAINGIGTGTVLIVGEFENGPYATPTEVTSAQDVQNNFGTLGYVYGGVPGNNPCAVSRKADGAVAAEFWNGNGFVQLNGKQFARLILCRVDTSVGSVQLTPRAFITSSNPSFRYVLAAGQVLGLDVGAGAQTATFSATAGTVTSVAATYALNPGDTVTLGYDGAPNFVVTFLSGDTTQGAVIARINQYAGFAFAATSAGQFSLTSLQKGTQAQVRVVATSSGGVLTALGLTVATTFGTGNVANIAAVTAQEVTAVVQAAISNTAVEVDQNGALRISDTLATQPSYVAVTAATTATGLGFTPGQLGTFQGIGGVLSTPAALPLPNAGTITLAIDDNFGASGINGGQPFTVTITTNMTLAAFVTAVNTAAGATVAFADSTTGFYLAGKNPGGRINVVGSSAGNVLSQTGLSVGITTGPGYAIGVLPAGTVVQDATAAHVFVTTQDIAFASTGITIGGIVQPSLGPWLVKVRHAVDDTTGTAATAGTVTVCPTPPLLYSVSVNNLQPTTAALTETQIDAAYVLALNSTLDLNSIARQVNIVYSARQSNAVRRTIRTNVLTASASGMFGRVGAIRPPLGTSKSVAQSISAEPGVGAYRDQRVIYCYPGLRTFVPIIGQRGVAGGTGYTSDGTVDVGADGFLASIMSQLPPEENPGQTTPFTTAVVGLESSANAQGYTIVDYQNFKNAGICAPRFDDGTCIFQSGVTSVDPNVNGGLSRIARRRMADFIQDTLSLRLKAFGKKLNTNVRRIAIQGEIRAFMEDLLGLNNPGTQRIAGFTLSIKGNTPTTLGQGLFRIRLDVRTLSSLDAIVLQTTIGDQVQVQEQLPAAA